MMRDPSQARAALPERGLSASRSRVHYQPKYGDEGDGKRARCNSLSTNEPTCLLPYHLIPNPVVEYAYAKENRGVASCDQGRVGAPLQEGSRPRRTRSLSDRMAAE